MRVLIKFLRDRRPFVRRCTEELLNIAQPVGILTDEGSEISEPVPVLRMGRDDVGDTRINLLFVGSEGYKRVEKQLKAESCRA